MSLGDNVTCENLFGKKCKDCIHYSMENEGSVFGHINELDEIESEWGEVWPRDEEHKIVDGPWLIPNCFYREFDMFDYEYLAESCEYYAPMLLPENIIKHDEFAWDHIEAEINERRWLRKSTWLKTLST